MQSPEQVSSGVNEDSGYTSILAVEYFVFFVFFFGFLMVPPEVIFDICIITYKARIAKYFFSIKIGKSPAVIAIIAPVTARAVLYVIY